MIHLLQKLALSAKEKKYYRKGELGPGVSKKKITPPPKVTKPQVWEVSAHPHDAERAGKHIDLRLGDRGTGIAHSFVLPKKMDLPKPGESTRVIPTYDHTIPYMDFTGRISTPYGKGMVHRGRRTQAEVYHSEPGDEPGTKLRFNLYDEAAPEEFSIRKAKDGKWFLHNKTQSRDKRVDLPAAKPKYKEVDPDKIDFSDSAQSMMPKLDGAHGIIDLKAGRAPRVFSYRVGKKAKTGLIEHTHKMGDLLKTKVPKELDGTILRGEVLGVKGEKAVPAEQIAGLLNSKVFESRRKQQAEGVKLKAFPFSVVRHKGKDLDEAPFHVKREVLLEVVKKLPELELPEMAVTPEEKMNLLNRVRAKVHPLTEEGVVLVDKDSPGRPIKAKFAPDFDVFVRDVHPAISGKTGRAHDRAGAISYSWTRDGPIVGQLGGFGHQEARDMLKNPDRYKGRVAKVKAMKVFEGKGDQPGALFQPRFKEWHLDKGDIEKSARVAAFLDEIEKIALSGEDLEMIGRDIGATVKSLFTHGSFYGSEEEGKPPRQATRSGKAVASKLRDLGVNPKKARIAVAGGGGTGKSTLARIISEELGMKSVPLDKTNRIGWTNTDIQDYVDKKGIEPGTITEQSFLLNQVDPDKFDVIVRVHQDPQKTKGQLKERGRGAAQWALFDYPKVHRTVGTAFHATEGTTHRPTRNVELKVKPKGGFQANTILNKKLTGMGIDPTKMTRSQKVMSVTEGRKVRRAGMFAVLKG